MCYFHVSEQLHWWRMQAHGTKPDPHWSPEEYLGHADNYDLLKANILARWGFSAHKMSQCRQNCKERFFARKEPALLPTQVNVNGELLPALLDTGTAVTIACPSVVPRCLKATWVNTILKLPY